MENISSPNLTKLHAADCPDATFHLQIPSTSRLPPNKDERYRNVNKYLQEDCGNSDSDDVDQVYRTYNTYRVLAILEGTVSVCDRTPDYPPQQLLKHWADKFHDGIETKIRDTEFNDKSPHLTYFPLEKLPKKLHAIDPDVQYELHSKRYLGSIDCAQAKIIETPVYPCVLKLCVSTCARGVWIIRNEAEYLKRINFIQSNMPNADYILTEFVEDIAKNYAVHLYVSKTGEFTWFGAAEQRFDNAGVFSGGIYYHDHQPKIRKAVTGVLKPVVQAIHRKGYFGYVSIDVLIDAKGDCFVIDLNPRWGACMVAILGTTNAMLKKGYRVSLLVSHLSFNGPLASVLEALDKIQGGEVVVSVASQTDPVMCEVNIFAPTYADCCRIEKDLISMQPQKTDNLRI